MSLSSLLTQFVLLIIRAAFSTGAQTSRESASNQQNWKWQICNWNVLNVSHHVLSKGGKSSSGNQTGNRAFNSLENIAAGQISF